MSPPKSPFFRHLLLILVFSAAAAAASASDDADAMWELAKNLGNVPPSWKPGSDPCDDSWERVTCSSGRVTAINCPSLSLSGSLPAALGRLTSLQRLFLPGNAISGPLPSLSDLSSLQELHLDGNALSSIPATFFSGLSALTSVSLDDNPFAPWSLSDDLAQAASLLDFSASNASVTGSLPSFFAALPSLHSLSLSYNHLTGDLPASLATSAIRTLKLNNQKSADKLSGRIDVIASMTQLNLAWLQSNSFTGPIPDLSNLTALSSFNVRDNQLTGLVPDSLTSSPVLNGVALSNNKLQGPFPVFASKNITLDVDKGNNFCSPKPGPCDPRVAVLLSVAAGFGFPLSLASSWEGNDPCAGGWSGILCDAQGKNVTVLNFMNQHFNGTISPDIANLTSLTKLVLGNNSLTGPIPDSLTALPQLQLLDVSNNNLDGKVPAFARSVVLKLAGNPSLGKESSSPGGGGSGSGGGDSGSPVDGTPSPSSGNQYGKSSSSSTGMVVGIVIAALVLIGCCLATFLYLHHKKQALRFGRVQTQSPPNEQEDVKIGVDLNVNNGAVNELYSQSSTGSANTLIGENQGMVMSIQALRTATNNFSEDNILGSGGFGVVYKGKLNGSLVAVKRSNSTDQKGLAEFKAEIDVLRKVRHRHLVALLGYCMDGADRLLVYEYMSEGTLGQHLFGQNESRYSPLTWKQRLTIALDVARGIEYLHSLAQESFIHRDLKPSNILLDKDMRAKVSDFGLVKLANNQASMMTRLAGTFGYLAPEYALTGKVTTKVDVYAFGVVLMELILSRRALEETLPDDQSHLVTYFRRLILDKVKFMESVQSLNLDEEGCRSVIGVAELACHCTAREPSQRPDMSHAVNVLAPLVDQWKPSRYNDADAYGDSGTLTLEDLQMSDSSFSSHLYSRFT